MGVPPFLSLLEYIKNPNETYVVLGFNDGESVFYEEDLKNSAVKCMWQQWMAAMVLRVR